MKFRGEKVYSLFGKVDKFVKPTSQEGDAWKGSKLMTLKKATTLANQKLTKFTPENQYAYNLTKLNIISTMARMSQNK